jgi:apolipoprotein N-acyltransferase
MLSTLSKTSYRTRLIIAAVAGAANVLAFAPFHLWPLQLIALALMLVLVVSPLSASGNVLSIKRVFTLGWCFSFCWMYAGVAWLLIALSRYGGMPIALAMFSLALLLAFLATYAGAAFALIVWVQRRWRVALPLVALLLFPSFWILNEWMRNWLFTGFPWIIAGYAHNLSPLNGYAPLLGVFGIGWICAMLAGAIALSVLSRDTWRWTTGLLASVLALGAGMHQIAWTDSVGKPISVRLLQGNVAQDMKFNPEHLNESLRLYHRMITEAPADLIATPETALPMLSSRLPDDYLPRLDQFAQETGSHLIVGVAVHDGGPVYSNSVLGFARGLSKPYRYDKHHLVPFGEFIPYGFRWFVDWMEMPMGDFSSAGLLQAPMAVRDQLVLPNICYEDLFGEEIAAQLAHQNAQTGRSATILLNTSNIAWYGDSLAIPQHLQISQMRALETGRPMLRSTNTGATAIIDPKGKVLAQLTPITQGTLSAHVQGMSGLTPYVRVGNWGMVGLCCLSFLAVFVAVWRRDRDVGLKA